MQYRALIVGCKLARLALMGAFRRLQPGIELIEAANSFDALDALLKHSIPIFRRMPELGEEQRRALEL